MPTKKEDKRKLRHGEWVEQITECQSSRMKIKKRVHSKFQECNHYHKTHTTKREIYKKTAIKERNGNNAKKRRT